MSKPKKLKLNPPDFVQWHNNWPTFKSHPSFAGLDGCIGYPIEKPSDCDCNLSYFYAEKFGFDPVGNETQEQIAAYLKRIREFAFA